MRLVFTLTPSKPRDFTLGTLTDQSPPPRPTTYTLDKNSGGIIFINEQEMVEWRVLSSSEPQQSKYADLVGVGTDSEHY